MPDIFGAILFFVFCIGVSYFEHSKFGTVITPFGVIAWPYAIIVLMVNFCWKHFGFFPVSLESILFVILCLIFFIAGAYSVLFLLGDKWQESIIVKKEQHDLGKILALYRPLFLLLAVVSIIAGGLQFYRVSMEFGLIGMASNAFRDAYGSGPLSHIMLLSRPAFIFLFVDYLFRRKKSTLILLVAIFLIVMARQVKYHVIVLLLGSIYLGYLNNLMRFSLKKVLLYAVVIYVIFNLSYAVGFSTLGLGYAYSARVQTFLFNHFFTYLFGGPIGFSEILKNPAYPLFSSKELLAVPINLIGLFHGDHSSVNIIFSNWVPVSNIHRYFHGSNVFGLFGTLYVYIGTYATFIYMFFVGIFTYSIGSLARRDKSRIGFQLMYVFLLGFLTLAFFGFYFNMLSFVEGSFFMVLIPPVYLLICKAFRFAWMNHQA